MHSTLASADIRNERAILVILGATGDLAKKKIIPSLWHLFQEERVPRELSVIGLARSELSEEQWRTFVYEATAQGCQESVPEDAFARFFKHFSYQAGDFRETETFEHLAAAVRNTEDAWGTCGNKLFYLAVPPAAYEPIFQGLAAVELNVPCGGELGWSRILIEKPFGTDLKSAQALQELLTQYFQEEQIYRIDHYLFKEIVQGIENFRFSNNLFENQWDNTTIERIDISLLETIGAEDRGAFYDTVGALRDVGQNHLMEMLAAITMAYPREMDASAIQANRAGLLETLAPWSEASIRENTYRAQYDGYRDIDGVADDSDTETYFALKTQLEHPRWRGVPIYMQAGKRMGEARKEIVLTLAHPQVCHLCELGEHGPNRIIFRLEPNDEIIINFWTKKPGLEKELVERTFSFFLYEKSNNVQYVEEYAKVLHAAIGGRRGLFTGPKEVEALWRFTDPIVAGWQQNLTSLEHYTPGVTPQPALLTRGVATDEHAAQTSRSAVGMIGLGRMGFNMALHLHEDGYDVFGVDKSEAALAQARESGLTVFDKNADMLSQLTAPRVIWLMVPSQFVDSVIEELIPLLAKGDTIIDGGNSFYKDTLARHEKLRAHNVHFLDCGTSGGVGGARHGASLMVGGEQEVFTEHEHIFKTLAAKDGYARVGGPGAGHFVKMVHNGIEYGMMGAIAEGMSVLNDHKQQFDISLPNALKAYSHESIIDSNLVDWLADACKEGQIGKIEGTVPHGETEDEMEHVTTIAPTPVLAAALDQRKQTRGNPSYAGKLIAAMRNQFGGHATKEKKS